MPEHEAEVLNQHEASVSEPSSEALFAMSSLATHSPERADAPDTEAFHEDEVLRSWETSQYDSAQQYFQEIIKVPLLNAEQEVELAKQIEAGVYAREKLRQVEGGESTGKELYDGYFRDLHLIAREGDKAKEHMLMANLRLSVHIAKRYTGQGLPLLDLIQEGNFGINRAIEMFDYTKGYKFSTYATWWIRQTITRALDDQSRTIRLPVHMVEKISTMKSTRRELTMRLGREPSDEEVAAARDVTVEEVRKWEGYDRVPLSIHMELSGEDSMLGDLIADSDYNTEDEVMSHLEQEESRAQVAALLSLVSEQTAEVLKLRFFEGLTLEEAGDRLNLTRERVRQIEQLGLATLRATRENDGSGWTAETLTNSRLSQAVDRALAAGAIGERDAGVARMYLGLTDNSEAQERKAIAEAYGITRHSIGKITARVLVKTGITIPPAQVRSWLQAQESAPAPETSLTEAAARPALSEEERPAQEPPECKVAVAAQSKHWAKPKREAGSEYLPEFLGDTSRDAHDAFFDVTHHNILNPDEVAVLVRRIQQGKRAAQNQEVESEEMREAQVADGRLARQVLVSHNFALVRNLVFKHIAKVPTSSRLIDDLVQEGNAALISAAGTYELNRGAEFSTYAYVAIGRALRRFISKEVKWTRPGRGRVSFEWLEEESEREDRAEAGGELRVKDLEKLADPTTEVAFEHAENKGSMPALWRRIENHVTPQQFRVLQMRYGQGLTSYEIAEELNVSRQAITQAETLGLKRVRRLFDQAEALRAAKLDKKIENVVAMRYGLTAEHPVPLGRPEVARITGMSEVKVAYYEQKGKSQIAQGPEATVIEEAEE